MGKWDSIKLSSLESITRFENELPQLCGYKENYIIIPERPESAIIVENYYDTEIISFRRCLQCFWLIGNVVFEGIIRENECHLPPIDIEVIIADKIKTFTFTAEYIGRANIYQFTGTIDFVELSSLKDYKDEYYITLDYNKTLALNDIEEENFVKDLHPIVKLSFSEMHWNMIIEGGNWDDKIAIAKDIIRYDIERLLTEHKVWVDEESGQKLIDVIANPETYALASDYKTIQLIYEDMAETSLSAELYLKKANSYKLKYIAELNNAWQRSNLDPFLTGKAGIYRADLMGELER